MSAFTHRARRAATLIWEASKNTEPNLDDQERIEVCILALQRLLPDDVPHSVASAAVGAVAMPAEVN